MANLSRAATAILAVCGAVSTALSLVCFYYILTYPQSPNGIELLGRINTLGNLSQKLLTAGVFAAIVCDIFAKRKSKE